jgi:mono/diheme cytochrome c family protein
MNRNVKWLACGLVLLLLTLLLVEITVSRAMAQRRRSRAQVRGQKVVDLFRTNCARCHGADGRGDTPLGHTYKSPDLTDPEWWRKNSNITSTAQLSAIVRRGKGGMPAFGKKLTRTDIRLLVGYVRKFKS